MNKNIESELILFWPKKKWKTKAKTKENGKGGGVKKAKEKKKNELNKRDSIFQKCVSGDLKKKKFYAVLHAFDQNRTKN